jgi:uncharacterized membrane protein YeiH
VGGGTVRDIFLAQVPRVLQSGALPIAAAFAGGGAYFVLRVVAATLHWNLPRIANP